MRLHHFPRPRIYGLRRDRCDHRDQLFTYTPRVLPQAVDLRSWFGPIPVEDQGSVGSCTANAFASCMEFWQVRLKPSFRHDLSRLFLYYNERLAEGNVADDAGAELRTGVKSLTRHGICDEAMWPYVPIQFATKPTSDCYTDALQHRVTAYRRIRSLQTLRVALADGYPVAFGFQVFASFESADVADTGIVPMPRTGWFGLWREPELGGHAVLAVGYDDTRDYPRRSSRHPIGCILCRNSWGSKWGDGGHFWLPYQFILDPDLSSDFWAITQTTFHGVNQ